jgi:AraC-like DNA-binding protein
MHCDCCLKLLRIELGRVGIEISRAELGDVTLLFDPHQYSLKQVRDLLKSIGFEVVEERDHLLVEEIKLTVIELVHNSTLNAMVRNSDFLVGRFGKSYQHLSHVFSHHEHITLEKFIIRHRIARAMELIQEGDLTLSEIAYMMGYSSVQYLSAQFKEVAGVSVTEFKKDMGTYRTAFMKNEL